MKIQHTPMKLVEEIKIYKFTAITCMRDTNRQFLVNNGKGYNIEGKNKKKHSYLYRYSTYIQ